MSASTSTIRSCPSCGAVVSEPPEQVSAACAYCRSTLVESERAATRIDRVAPFRIPRKAAEDRLRAYVADDFWAPGKIRKAAKAASISESDLRGALVPFFAYDATVRGEYRGRVGIHWYREETRTKKNGEVERVQVRETEWHGIRGSVAHELEDHLVSASAGLSEAESRQLLPFDLGRAYPFDPKLVAGFSAELPTRGREEVERAAQQSIQDATESAVRRRLLPGDERKVDRLDAEAEVHKVDLVLAPVWVATFRVSGQMIRLLVHGQSGRVTGKVPVSTIKVAVAIVLAAAVLVTAYILLRGGETWM